MNYLKAPTGLLDELKRLEGLLETDLISTAAGALDLKNRCLAIEESAADSRDGKTAERAASLAECWEERRVAILQEARFQWDAGWRDCSDDVANVELYLAGGEYRNGWDARNAFAGGLEQVRREGLREAREFLAKHS